MDSITITKEQFYDALEKANEKFIEVGEKKEHKTDPMALFMMKIQNTLYGGLLADELFGKNNTDNK